jgi:hypothetical protein
MSSGTQGWEFDVSHDGQRFLMAAPTASGSDAVTVTTNWTAMLK